MKIIAFEEHYVLPAIAEANPNNPRKLFGEVRNGHFEDSDADGGWPTGILDIGEGRIAAMDAAGIDVQILSNVPGAEAVEVPLAVELASKANDAVAAAVTQHRARFLGFATLPMGDPKAAAAELERAVRDHGFVGALINGHVNGRYLDDKFFWPVFESAETLGVPIYLHPTVPPQPVIDACYKGFSPGVSAMLSIAGAGWHIDTGIHCLRLILGGVFDRFPRLQLIVGHQFEALSWMAWRADYAFPVAESGLKRTVKEYLRENFYGGILAGDFANQEPGATDPSWSLSFNAYQAMVNVIGIDRVVFTADYPFGSMKSGRQFLEQLPINPADKEKIAHLNAERLLGLSNKVQPQ
ncbi:MAG TPA: amidohydrolase family protein [Mycobacterium sp.]|uniref:amidohydrolase family protein n=1 Tax=Mycobacterium sp. TaxID=1785 RepID=UPI002D21F545|nr:amidohydrolase family protein [Mycobacterium sp.]HXY64083.1 amidohydrolase family protein [Mycobacterium sp.]